MAAKEKRYAKKYARMLFNSTGVDLAERVIAELNIINGLMDGSREIKNFFLSPLFGEEERQKTIKSLSEKLGFSEETGKFLVFITQHKMVSALPDIIRHFVNIYFEKKKKAKATVITPFKFDGKYEDRLVVSLRKLTGRDVDIEYLYDPELLGGIVVKVGSTMYDSSLRGQLRLLKEELIKG
ncbi:ATP synthase delta chain [hydrothermal vent metagenome]|uniref:ATP synthase delta chain n=1 Tax=hydrothermal vent metagenome TaxID=652676 RepID=A0A3B1D783_9ZZZZ